MAKQTYSRGVSTVERPLTTVQRTEVVRLSIQGQRQIAAAILDPPAPSPALERATRRYRELFGVA